VTSGHWNGIVPVGTPVRYWPTLEREYAQDYLDTYTTAPAWETEDGTVVCRIRRVSTPVAVTHLWVRVSHLERDKERRRPMGAFVNVSEDPE